MVAKKTKKAAKKAVKVEEPVVAPEPSGKRPGRTRKPAQ